MINYSSSASEFSLPTPINQPINQFPIDKEHPEELLGQWLSNFSITLNQPLPKESLGKINSIQKDLYGCTIQTVNSWINKQHINEKTSLKLVSYQDKKYQQDRERIYILIRRITVRQTEIVALCRFHKNEDGLYIAVESYALGSLKWLNLVFHNLLLLFVLQIALGIGASFSVFLGFLGFIIVLFFPLLYAYWIWGGVIKGIRQGESFFRALRQRFPKRISDNSFDIDDTLIFLKSLLPLIISSTHQAFSQNGLQIKALENYLEEISNKIQQQSFVINTGGGNILGAMFGGNNNRIYNQ